MLGYDYTYISTCVDLSFMQYLTALLVNQGQFFQIAPLKMLRKVLKPVNYENLTFH